MIANFLDGVPDRDDQIRRSVSVGSSSGFVFAADAPRRRSRRGRRGRVVTGGRERRPAAAAAASLWVKAHNPGDVPSMEEDKGSWVRIGGGGGGLLLTAATHRVGMRGEKLNGTAAFRSLGEEVRGCRYHDEGGLELFERYSRGNCLLECRWRRAEERCGCRPWDVPSGDGSRRGLGSAGG